MKLQHPKDSVRRRGIATALLGCVLSLFVAPAALAEPFEDDGAGTGAAETQTERGWEHRNDLEFLNQHDDAAAPTAPRNVDTLRLQHHLRFLEGQEAAGGSETVPETGSDGSSQGWWIGSGVVAAVVIASIVLAVVRSRRPESITQVRHDADRIDA